MKSKPDVRLRRVYGEPTRGDGTRLPVDRVWPSSKIPSGLRRWPGCTGWPGTSG